MARCSFTLPLGATLQRAATPLTGRPPLPSSTSKAIRESLVSISTSVNPAASTVGRKSLSGTKVCMQSGQFTPGARPSPFSTDSAIAILPPAFSTRCASRNAAGLSGARQNAPFDIARLQGGFVGIWHG